MQVFEHTGRRREVMSCSQVTELNRSEAQHRQQELMMLRGSKHCRQNNKHNTSATTCATAGDFAKCATFEAAVKVK